MRKKYGCNGWWHQKNLLRKGEALKINTSKRQIMQCSAKFLPECMGEHAPGPSCFVMYQIA